MNNSDHFKTPFIRIFLILYIVHFDFEPFSSSGARWCTAMFGGVGYLRCLAAGGLRVRIHLKLSRRDPGQVLHAQYCASARNSDSVSALLSGAPLSGNLERAL
jgi:hypothetical protein